MDENNNSFDPTGALNQYTNNNGSTFIAGGMNNTGQGNVQAGTGTSGGSGLQTIQQPVKQTTFTPSVGMQPTTTPTGAVNGQQPITGTIIPAQAMVSGGKFAVTGGNKTPLSTDNTNAPAGTVNISAPTSTTPTSTTTDTSTSTPIGGTPSNLTPTNSSSTSPTTQYGAPTSQDASGRITYANGHVESDQEMAARQSLQNVAQTQTDLNNLSTTKSYLTNAGNQASSAASLASQQSEALEKNADKNYIDQNAQNEQAQATLAYKSAAANAQYQLSKTNLTIQNTKNAIGSLNGTFGHTGSNSFDELQSTLQDAKQYLDYWNAQYMTSAGSLGKQLQDSQQKAAYMIGTINDQMNKDISATVLSQMVKLGQINSTGNLDTPENTLKAQTDMLNGINDQITYITDKYNTAAKDLTSQLQTAKDAQDSYLKYTQDQNKVDDTTSTKMGYLTNADGQPILDNNGNKQTFDNTDVAEFLNGGKVVDGVDANGNYGPGIAVKTVGGTSAFRLLNQQTLPDSQIATWTKSVNDQILGGTSASDALASLPPTISDADRNKIISGLTPDAIMKDKVLGKQYAIDQQIFSSDPNQSKSGILSYVQDAMDTINTQAKSNVFSVSPFKIAQDIEETAAQNEGGGMSHEQALNSAISSVMTNETYADPQYKQFLSNLNATSQATIGHLQAESNSLNSKAASESTTNTTSSGGIVDMTNTLVRPTGSTNVGQDTNNPGNIEVLAGVTPPNGAIGTYTNSNGSYYVFPDMKTGEQAQIADITAKQNGNTSTGLNGQSTVADLIKTWAPDSQESYGQAFTKATGISTDTAIGGLDAATIAKGIQAGEGVDTSKNATVPQTTTKDFGYTNAEKPTSDIANIVDPTTNVTPNAVWANMGNYVLGGGKIPSLGLGTKAQILAQKTAIENKSGEVLDKLGMSMPQLENEYKASGAALKSLATTAANTYAYEAQALKNSDLVAKYAATNNNGEMPDINGFTNWLKTTTGQEQPSDLATAIYGFANEYAKTVSGGVGSSKSLSDSQQAAAARLINADQSPETLAGVMNVMKQEMENRKITLQSQISDTSNGGAGSNLARFFNYLATGSDSTPTTTTPSSSNSSSGTTPDFSSALLNQ